MKKVIFRITKHQILTYLLTSLLMRNFKKKMPLPSLTLSLIIWTKIALIQVTGMKISIIHLSERKLNYQMTLLLS